MSLSAESDSGGDVSQGAPTCPSEVQARDESPQSN